jgi:hypothetical protein
MPDLVSRPALAQVAVSLVPPGQVAALVGHTPKNCPLYTLALNR